MISEIQCPYCRMSQIYDPDMLDEDLVCSYCGRIVVARRVSTPRVRAGVGVRAAGKMDAPVPESRPVGFWPRVLAATVDSLVTSIAFFGFIFLLGVTLALLDFRMGIDYFPVLCTLSAVVIGWLYSALMESSPCQATLGKMVIRAKVVNGMGRRLGFGQATGRFFAKYISAVILCIGYVMAAFDERKRGLHDIIASTCVVSARRLGWDGKST